MVPTHEKNDKYWERREKNNVAAKRSREARRLRENQIAMRTAFLEVRRNPQLIIGSQQRANFWGLSKIDPTYGICSCVVLSHTG